MKTGRNGARVGGKQAQTGKNTWVKGVSRRKHAQKGKLLCISLNYGNKTGVGTQKYLSAKATEKKNTWKHIITTVRTKLVWTEKSRESKTQICPNKGETN